MPITPWTYMPIGDIAPPDSHDIRAPNGQGFVDWADVLGLTDLDDTVRLWQAHRARVSERSDAASAPRRDD